MGLKKGTRACCLQSRWPQERAATTSFFANLLPFREIGEGIYWLVMLVHLWRTEQRQDFRLYVDSSPELGRRQGLFDAATHTIARFFPLPCVVSASEIAVGS